jgi:acyl-CoA oxidase
MIFKIRFVVTEFIVNTPNTLAQKYWITNGAVHAKHVVVMAQLIVKGQNHGIHAVLGEQKNNIFKNIFS